MSDPMLCTGEPVGILPNNELSSLWKQWFTYYIALSYDRIHVISRDHNRLEVKKLICHALPCSSPWYGVYWDRLLSTGTEAHILHAIGALWLHNNDRRHKHKPYATVHCHNVLRLWTVLAAETGRHSNHIGARQWGREHTQSVEPRK
jgi:hypothetical protein